MVMGNNKLKKEERKQKEKMKKRKGKNTYEGL